jgi:ATP-binding cassette, subfamily B, bacterial
MFSKFAFQKQMDAMDCGPTCLHMIARYYGRILPLDDLREKCGITRLGVTLGGIANAAENFNLKTVAIRASMRTLHEEVPLPCIAHWQEKHFIVVHAVTNKHVHVADPELGLIKYSQQDFKAGWLNSVNPDENAEGVLLLLETTPEFYADQDLQQKKVKGLGFIWPYCRPYLSFFIPLFLGMLVCSLILLAFFF